MFGIGGFELFLILIFGFLIVGPDRLPAIAKTVGQAIGKFKGAQEEMNKVIRTEVYDPESKAPFKDPLEVLDKLGSSGSAGSASPKTSTKPAADKASASEGKRESFSERKARYEKERAAKKAEDAKRAAEEARAANAAKDVPAKVDESSENKKGE